MPSPYKALINEALRKPSSMRHDNESTSSQYACSDGRPTGRPIRQTQRRQTNTADPKKVDQNSDYSIVFRSGSYLHDNGPVRTQAGSIYIHRVGQYTWCRLVAHSIASRDIGTEVLWIGCSFGPFTAISLRWVTQVETGWFRSGFILPYL
jgi:hypothetical protein